MSGHISSTEWQIYGYKPWGMSSYKINADDAFGEDKGIFHRINLVTPNVLRHIE